MKAKAKIQVINQILGLVLGLLGAYLTVSWFGWKMLLVIFLLLWSNNISMKGHE